MQGMKSIFIYALALGLAEDALKEAIAGISEKIIARGQAHFDPLLSEEKLLQKGIRGEFFDSFFQGQTQSVWVRANPSKIADYLLNPETWENYQRKYGVNFSSCMVSSKPGPCPMQFKLFGMDYDINAFPTSYQYAENSISYWVARQMIARFKILLKPERGGTRLTVNYIMELPPSLSSEGAALLLNIMQMPKLLERLLLNVKNDTEGVS